MGPDIHSGHYWGNLDGTWFRAEQAKDHRAISEVVAAAFGSQAEAELVEDIRESEYFIADLSIVAQSEGRIIGHVMVSYATLLCHQEGVSRIAMLSPLAVCPSFQRTAHWVSARSPRDGQSGRAWGATARARGEPSVLRALGL